MILINLLPPELRRARRSGVNPVLLAAAAGIILVLGAAGTWAWVEFGRIKSAQATLEGLDADLVAAKAQADKVRAIDKEITAFEALHGTITSLISRKVFWARTLDDFCNLLSQQGENRWTREGYEVRCTGLTIAASAAAKAASPRGAKSTGETVTYSFRANFKIVGQQRDQAGDYVQSFFQSVDLSPFWREHGFIGHAEDPFRGDSPRTVAAINRVVTDLSLEWKRAKILSPPQGVQK